MARVVPELLNFSLNNDTNSLREIVLAKQAFISGNDVEFDIPDAVVRSWQLSMDGGLQPNMMLPSLKHVELNLSDIEEAMIETVSELFHNIDTRTESFRINRPYFYLLNHHGLIIHEYGRQEDLDYMHSLNIGIGTDFSFEAIGTSANSIAISERKSVQMLGAYSYLDVFKDNLHSATPVVVDGNVIGVIGLINVELSQQAFENTNRRYSALVYRAIAIKNAVQRVVDNNESELIRETINLNSDIDETYGIVTVDTDNRIAYICNHAKQFISFDEVKKLEHYIPNIDHIISNINFNKNSNKRQYPVSLQGGKLRALVSQLKDAGRVIGHTLFLSKPNDNDTRYSLDNIIGSHISLNTMKEKINNVSSSKHNVLILGESGTGKEMIAQAIHEQSGVKGPFVAINCASIPANLIESELFGYVEGAFTGAAKTGSMGKIEFANNGTLFLDEIGDMPLELQPVLLRVLEERQVIPIGSKKPIPINIRVIAATNVDLYESVQNKKFREDLYFRLSVINVDVPPLRERGEDILELAKYFIGKERSINQDVELSEEVKTIFLSYDWPGNIRQLENAIISSMYSLNNEKVIDIKHLPKIIAKKIGNISQEKLEYEDDMLENIKYTLERNNGNYTKTAKMLGISRTTLYNKLKKTK